MSATTAVRRRFGLPSVVVSIGALLLGVLILGLLGVGLFVPTATG